MTVLTFQVGWRSKHMIYNRPLVAPNNADMNKLFGSGAVLELISSNTYRNSPITSGFVISKPLKQSLTDNLNVAFDANKIFFRKLTNAYAFSPFDASLSNTAWNQVFTSSASIVFNSTNTYDIGTSSSTVRNIYSQNAVTVVSDRNAKDDIQDISDIVLQAWAEVKPKQYKLKGDDNWSFGYIAQDIVEAFTRHGLDYKQYNIVHEEDGKFMLKYDMCHVLDRALMRP